MIDSPYATSERVRRAPLNFSALGLAAAMLLVASGCGDDAPSMDGGPEQCTEDSACDDGIFCNGAEVCDPTAGASANGCAPASEPACDSEETCDETLDACMAGCPDADDDGEASAACGGSDCDDSDPTIYAGATEVCDLEAVDEDCDPTTFGDRDIDEDGYVSAICCNGTECGIDCDDTRRGANPNVPEVCDGRDNDCDGTVDEELLQSVFVDADRDLHGDPDNTTLACPGRVGTSASQLDCDDGEPYANTPQVEIEDGVDNDCDDIIDEDPQSVTWYADADGDGFGDPHGDTVSSSTVQAGYSLLPLDCDDSDASVSPLADEQCNGRDDDCDGEANFAIGINDWEDDDGDGVPDAACAASGGDCDDTDPRSYPGAPETCDGWDNDCDGTVDGESCGPVTGGCEPGMPCVQVTLFDFAGNELGPTRGANLDGRISDETDATTCYQPDLTDSLDGSSGVDNQAALLKQALGGTQEGFTSNPTSFDLSVVGAGSGMVSVTFADFPSGTAALTAGDVFELSTTETITVPFDVVTITLHDVAIDGRVVAGGVEEVSISGWFLVSELVDRIATAYELDPATLSPVLDALADLQPDGEGGCSALSAAILTTVEASAAP